MTSEPLWHPDLLRRFVAAPYIFKYDGPGQLHIESNDLEIALGMRRAGVVLPQGQQPRRLLCKLIRDMSAPADGSEISIVSDGPLRILYQGTGTILIHDRERLELLGFISRNVKVHELVSSLIPALLSPKIKIRQSSCFYKEVTNETLCDDNWP
jgi:hypothetical protein